MTLEPAPNGYPLSPARRVKRGFTRLGFACAAIALAIGVAVIFSTVPGAANYPLRQYEAKLCLRKAWGEQRLKVWTYNPNVIDGDASGCPGAYSMNLSEIETAPVKPSAFWLMVEALYEAVGGTILGVVIAFTIPWGIGWIIAGFLRD